MLILQTKGFGRDQSGSIAIIFALVFLILVTVAGGAVDYGRYAAARAKTLQAMDAAVLAAGRVLQIENGDEAKALAAARAYYGQNKPKSLSDDNVEFSIENGNIAVSVSDARIKTPFLGLLGINELKIRNISKAVSSAGENTGSHVEISLMLDTTGSMCSGSCGPSSRLGAMQLAAKDLIDIVIWKDQSQYTSRVALVPFAQNVNVGAEYYQAITGKPASRHGDFDACIIERDGRNRYTGRPPDAKAGYFATAERYTCGWSTPILPLTSNKQALFDQLDRFKPAGSTAGHLGTQFAWYTLDPEWGDIWGHKSAARPYAMTKRAKKNGNPELYKIAVLLTDGNFNAAYSGPRSDEQARKFCDNMKKKGIVVYTIGFEVQPFGPAYRTMEHCASSPEHFYDARDYNAVRSAFRDIALQVSTLRLAE